MPKGWGSKGDHLTILHLLGEDNTRKFFKTINVCLCTCVPRDQLIPQIPRFPPNTSIIGALYPPNTSLRSDNTTDTIILRNVVGNKTMGVLNNNDELQSGFC